MVVGSGTGVVGNATLTLGQTNNLFVDNVQVGLITGTKYIKSPAGVDVEPARHPIARMTLASPGVGYNTRYIYKTGTMDLSGRSPARGPRNADDGSKRPEAGRAEWYAVDQ